MSDDAYFYEPLGEGVYRPSINVQGAWLETEQHMAPVGGLLAHALESFQHREELQLARVSYEILGQIRRADTQVQVEVVRPGRTIELLTATATIDGRAAVRANGWRLVRGETEAIAGSSDAAMPDPEQWPVWKPDELWPGGYIASVQARRDPDSRPGRGRAWLRNDNRLLKGEQVGETAHFLRLVDTANGIATRVSPREWMFPNTDLSVHLFRQPHGEWVGFDTSVSIGPSGVGLTSSILHDLEGPVGRVEQILTVRPQPPRG